MNREVVEKAFAAMEENPNRLYIEEGIVLNAAAYFERYGIPQTIPDCNTVACFAGWIVLANRPAVIESAKRADQYGVISWPNIEAHATELLEMAPSEAHDLFTLTRWPSTFFTAYKNAETGAQRLAVLKERVAHYETYHK